MKKALFKQLRKVLPENVYIKSSMWVRRLWARNVKSEDIRYEFGFGFGELYHPYVEALRCEGEEKAASLLHDFYTAHGAWLDCLQSEAQAMAVQTWKLNPEDIRRNLGLGSFRVGQFEMGTRSPRKFALERARYLYSIRRSIESNGFDLEKFGDYPKGVNLQGKTLVLGGQHRLAVLHEMGERSFSVYIGRHGEVPSRIKLDYDIHKLPIVKHEVIGEEDARSVLTRILNGLKKDEAESRGYPFASQFK